MNCSLCREDSLRRTVSSQEAKIILPKRHLASAAALRRTFGSTALPTRLYRVNTMQCGSHR